MHSSPVDISLFHRSSYSLDTVSTSFSQSEMHHIYQNALFNALCNGSINYFICRHNCITIGTCNTEIHRLCYKQPCSKYRNSMNMRITHTHTHTVIFSRSIFHIRTWLLEMCSFALLLRRDHRLMLPSMLLRLIPYVTHSNHFLLGRVLLIALIL